MGYLTAKQFSEKWGISERRIIKLCKEDRIIGAIKNGMIWVIPEDTLKPSDKRSNVYKYINTQKRVMVVNVTNPLFNYLLPVLKKEGYIVDVINDENIKIQETSKYYDGLIYMEQEGLNLEVIMEFAKKMNYESSIVLLSNKDNKIEKLANDLKEKVGIRINNITLNIPNCSRMIINYDEIAEDIVGLLTKFKNTTGVNIVSDGGYIKFNEDDRTCNLKTGQFYRSINTYFKNLKKDSYLWCASTMLEDEWTEEPLEMKFRVLNLEVANRGVKVERIFIFSKDKIKQFKNNKTLKIYMQSNIKTMFVDLDEIRNKEPELLDIIGNGWDGIDKETLIVDIADSDEERGYISINKKEVTKAYRCFERLKKYSKDLKQVLK